MSFYLKRIFKEKVYLIIINKGRDYASTDFPEDVSEMPNTVIEVLDDEIEEVLDVNATRKRTASTSPPNHRAKKKREAFRATEKSAAKMKSMYLKKHGQNIRTFHVGDTVTVGIPKLDRTSTDQQRLPCQVIGSAGEKDVHYTLATEFGVLKSKYRGGDLMPFNGTPLTTIKEEEIFLREAARKKYPQSKFL